MKQIAGVFFYFFKLIDHKHRSLNLWAKENYTKITNTFSLFHKEFEEEKDKKKCFVFYL